jgi:uncharacterized protein YndB with AHSA1/START domain
MVDFTIDTRIERPPADVFAYVTDPAKLATWQTNTVVAERIDGDGPLRSGARLREVHRAPGGKELESIVEVSAYEPDSRFGLHVVEGTPIDLDMTFAPAGGGTHVIFRAYGRLTGAMRFAQPLLGVVLKRQFSSQLETLKRVLETGP